MPEAIRAAGLLRHRLSGLPYFVLPVLATGLILRLALLSHSWADVPHGFSMGAALLLGLFTDAIYAGYFLAPLVLYLVLVPQRVFRTRLHRFLMTVAVAFECWLLLFTSLAEWMFWDEFGVRFNFIAVDYLVYTQEVVDNILESYPVVPLIVVLAVTALLIAAFYASLPGFRRWQSSTTPVRARLLAGLPLLFVPVAATFLVDNRELPGFENHYLEEISRNGAYSFFAAFRNNELEYHDFYIDEPDALARRRIRTLIGQPGEEFPVDPTTPERRHIQGRTDELRYNVIQVVVESLSADFLGVFGNEDGLTPNLDRLAGDGLLFSRLMATGTRTVRGMESLTLSVPPTPGRSIVKRPTNDVLQSTGTIFREKGYRPAFFYGGYGYFDNMNDFFTRNGFEIHDRGTESGDIIFANAWGVSDEDLYRWVLEDADRQYRKGEPFFDFVMTTSNHRPYTYPEGRIDIASGSGRAGAVKYTDHAFGRFLAQAREKPWFDETIFVIVADHCASSAGKTSLPVANYRIPLLFYAPGIVQPRVVDTLSSQIDVAPTLFGLLGWRYDSEFFGRDVLRARGDDGRALIGTYQSIGLLLADNRLTVLEPGKLAEAYLFDPVKATQARSEILAGQLTDTITYYQRASDLYSNRAGRGP